ncbi:hypothetical protein B0H21DRAFT_697683 [Amylocystis lapponica]|nr:hypothetical protein B0H21DRAFT_697683 [Amylocystis lapponica]
MAGHSSHWYCTVCECYHLDTVGRFDCEAWRIRDKDTLRQQAEAWRTAGSSAAQEKLFTSTGVRYTELWRLRYWDPTRQLVVDAMHCVLENLVSFHFREVLKLNWQAAESKETPRITDVIRDTETPSWLGSVPNNYGHAAAGTLKADEWRTLSTVYFPIALVSMWGEGSQHPSDKVATRYRRLLDHTMALVSAVIVVCKYTTSRTRMTQYRQYVRAWAQGLKELHPNVKPRVNSHMAFHIYDFLSLFGPVYSWWCFPFERLIGQLQRMPQNHKFG